MLSNVKYYLFLKNSKWKKIKDFSLKKFVDDLEKQENGKAPAKKSGDYNVDEETSSEIFKALQKEEWIPQPIRDTLKNLKDYLTYLIKSIKTVKSTLFSDRIPNYLFNLYRFIL